MLKSWKSPFRRGWGPVDSDVESSEEAALARGGPAKADPSIARLRSVMAELKVGDAEYDARQPGEPMVSFAPVVKDKDREKEPEARSAGTSPTVKNDATEVQTAMPNDVPTAPAVPSDGALSAAQQMIAEQRKAAEALLLEAYALEERLKNEAKAAQVASEVTAARQKVSAALQLEQQAKEAARAAAETRSALATERREAENQIVTARGEAKAAKAQVEHLEQKLRDAKQVAEQALSMIGLHEAHVKECASKEVVVKREGAEATARVVAFENARVEAEKQAKAAEERAKAVTSELPEKTQDFSGINDVQSLAARIAKQASALKRSGPGAHTGVIESEPKQATG